MLGWRRKRDGFEWHDYVRTTILVRRAKRRQKVDDARAAAVHGLKDAGSAAAHGLDEARAAAAESFRQAGRMGQAMGVSGAGAVAGLIHRAWATLGSLSRIARTSGADRARSIASHASQLAATISAPLLDRLSDRRARTIVGAVGVAALFAVAYRVWAVGFDTRALFASLLAVLTLGPALAAERRRDDVTHHADSRSTTVDDASLAPISMNLLRPVVIWGAVSALVVFGIGTLINPDGHQQLPTSAAITHTAAIPAPSRPAEPADNIHGRARAVTGDTLRIGRALVKLNHVVAPETGQTCTRADGRTWRCGEDARAALARLLRGARVDCTLSDDGSVGSIARGDCRKGDADLGSALVRDGHVFAETGFFARHASLESEARDNHRGMWAGQAQRPETFRAAAWEAARQKAPDSCPIKGRVTSRSKLYVMPWMDGYDSIKIRSSRGERWFCSEEDARRAGWRPSGIP